MAKPTQTAVVNDILVNQGADYDIQLTIKDNTGTVVDITGYSFLARIKESAESSTALAKFTQQEVDYKNGQVRLHLESDDTSAIDTSGDSYSDTSQYYYDVLMSDNDGNTTRILNGSAYISPGISQD